MCCQCPISRVGQDRGPPEASVSTNRRGGTYPAGSCWATHRSPPGRASTARPSASEAASATAVIGCHGGMRRVNAPGRPYHANTSAIGCGTTLAYSMPMAGIAEAGRSAGAVLVHGAVAGFPGGQVVIGPGPTEVPLAGWPGFIGCTGCTGVQHRGVVGHRGDDRGVVGGGVLVPGGLPHLVGGVFHLVGGVFGGPEL